MHNIEKWAQVWFSLASRKKNLNLQDLWYLSRKCFQALFGLPDFLPEAALVQNDQALFNCNWSSVS